MLVRCIDCTHCDAENLLCHPDSIDCHEEYKLDKEDLYTAARCDFFKKGE